MLSFRFSKATGNLIASSDVDGVVKVWSACPKAPSTLATFVSSSGVTALDWLSRVSDRYLVVSNSTGAVKICDQLERKTCHELNVGAGVVMIEAGGASGTVVAVSTSDPTSGDVAAGNFAVYDLKGNKLEHSFSPVVVGAGSGAGPVITCCKFNHNSQVLPIFHIIFLKELQFHIKKRKVKKKILILLLISYFYKKLSKIAA